ncbi:MAG: Electron transport complex protein RnfB [Clostridiales bacterium 38_11]|nr:MAG: Electron transport complex protein RnfB [Clostridiales bacterium 38_11]
MDSVLKAVATLGGLGLGFGLILAFASKVFHVEIDPKIIDVRNALPGANCGACGFPGCDALAKAIVNGEAAISACPVGGESTVVEISKIMGIEGHAGPKRVARVLCKGNYERTNKKYEYHGIMDCKASVMIQGGDKACPFGCLGNGSCVAICPFDAIHVVNGLAIVDEEKCTACEKCIKECPKGIIQLVPYQANVVVDCSNHLFGKEVKKDCKVGCIGCKICEKACAFDAVHVVDSLARIDYEKCTNCMVCAEKCPTKSITAMIEDRKKAYIISEKCIGCTICAQNCPVDCIAGEKEKVHVVDDRKCIGCSVCYEKCPVDAIEMR